MNKPKKMDKWEIEQAHQTLMSAMEIQKDKKLMKEVMKLMHKKKDDMHSLMKEYRMNDGDEEHLSK